MGIKIVQLRIPSELHDWLRAKAVEDERSANFVISKLLEQARERDEQKAAA